MDASGKHDVATIVGEVERCRSIVGGLLDLSRPPRLIAGAVALDALCEDVATRTAATTHVRGRVSHAGNVTVNADADKLRQVLTNLLLNAAQAGAHEVTLDVAGDDEAVRLRVSDDGPGIAAAVRDRLFEPFVTGRPDGTGLGLAVSRSIVAAHGGTLAVVPSERGAAFEIVLPRRGPEVAS
jgi:signal transduction histidine kinase